MLLGSINTPLNLLVVIVDVGCLIPRFEQHICLDATLTATDPHSNFLASELHFLLPLLWEFDIAVLTNARLPGK